VLDAHADFILGLTEAVPDITLEEIARRLAEERGVKVVATAVWKFLDRHDMTHKKRRLMRANRSGPMSKPGVKRGQGASPGLILGA
jgi:transposase